jgi:hypothetical protein
METMMTSSERVSPLHFLCFVWKGKSRDGSNYYLYWILTSCMVWLMCIRERSQPATKEKCVAFENLNCNFPCPILKGIEIGQAKYHYLLERKKLDGSGEFQVFFFFFPFSTFTFCFLKQSKYIFFFWWRRIWLKLIK